MIIIGYKGIPCEEFLKITSIQDIKNHTSLDNKVVWFKAKQDLDFTLARFCHTHQICFCVFVSSITECMLYASFKPKYLMCEQYEADSLQKLADSYLLDSKILALIYGIDEIESLAPKGIDGVIFYEAVGFSDSD